MRARATTAIPSSRTATIAAGRSPRSTGGQVPDGPLSAATLASIQATAGNQAATGLVEQGGAWFTIQRRPRAASDPADQPVTPADGVGGWTNADPRGESWNAGEKDIGTMRRIPIEGLDAGKQSEKDAANADLTDESAAGRAILVAPQGIVPTLPVNVMVQFHGYTETASRPYAGWRQNKQTGLVRDVALDRVEQQLQAAGESQLVAILPQGGIRSQFGEGDNAYALDPAAYARKVLDKATEVGAWGKAAPNPPMGSAILAGHSGGAHTISHALAAELVKPKKGKKGRAKAKGPSAFAEVVLFDAITGSGELDIFVDWVGARLDADLAALDAAPTPEAKSAYLVSSTRFRGYYATYKAYYTALRESIVTWFRKNYNALGPYAEELWTHYQVIDTGLGPSGHEYVMRGSRPGSKKAGPGNITDAIKSLGSPTAQKTLAETLGLPAAQAPATGQAPTGGSSGPATTSPSGAPVTASSPVGTPKLGKHVVDPAVTSQAAPVPDEAPAPDAAAAGPRSSADFIGDLGRTTLELLPKAERARFEAIAWVDLDYPGAKMLVKDTSDENLAKWQANADYVLFKIKDRHYIKGAHQAQAQALLDALMRVRPGGGERRANTSKTAILTQKQFRQDPAAYDAYIRKELQGIATEKVKMNHYAAEAYDAMKEVAKKEGVRLSIGNSFRERKVAEANAARVDNSNAVASYSSHSLGLAMDLNLRVKGMGNATETATAMTNITNLLRAPAYKWMFMRGASFGFYQFRNEPWHWEYNPEGFRQKFWADMPDLQPAVEADQPKSAGRKKSR